MKKIQVFIVVKVLNLNKVFNKIENRKKNNLTNKKVQNLNNIYFIFLKNYIII